MIYFFRRNHLSPWIIPGAIIFMGILFGLCGLTLWIISPDTAAQEPQISAITSIPASTSTPQPAPGSEGNVTEEDGSSVDTSGIALELYVQITNTGGDGLKLRSGPGTSSPARFLGKEGEVFQVKDGPRIADGFTWWFLVTPYDEHRSGWAASDFFLLIDTP
ncbi:MAG: SH3 domain-containing protein [Anaerolineaceae bacterium]